METEEKKKSKLGTVLKCGILIAVLVFVWQASQGADIIYNVPASSGASSSEQEQVLAASEETMSSGVEEESIPEETVETESDSDRTLIIEERWPNVPEDLLEHVLLEGRNGGYSATFTGDVLLFSIFVDEPGSAWTTDEINAIKEKQSVWVDSMMAEAQDRGVELNLITGYRRATASMALDREVPNEWASSALENADLISLREAADILEADNEAKETAVVFYSKTDGRSFARPRTLEGVLEYAILYENADEQGTFWHEIFHLFGAEDYYYPDTIKEAAKEYYPDSIMLSSSYSDIDNLTAYLIGWTDTLTDDALAVLQKTAGVTAAEMSNARTIENYTGYVTEWNMDSGIYTGYLEAGIMQGIGKMVYSDGDVYEGNFENGEYHGEGTYTWANGDSYTGQFVNGVRQGYGVYRFYNGDVYEGSYENNKINGQGTYTWANGSSYTGQWVKGTMEGYGVGTYTNGVVKEGYWKNGTYIGKNPE